MKLLRIFLISIVASILGGLNAHALVIDVFAQANSSTGGVGAFTGVNISAGDHLVMVTNPDDCWSAGASPRDSNADGLIGTGGSCQPTSLFPDWTQDGLSAPFGTLVGKIGAGAFFVVGTFYDQIVSDTGALTLYYWDSNNSDNSGSVAVTIRHNPGQTIPEPAMLGLLGLGFGLLLIRRRKS